MRDVSLVIVNHDGAEHLPACLDSVASLDYPHERLETIVVDNASTDASLELLAERYPWVRVLPQSENIGFAGAVNAGAGAASAECLALCNNDMRLDRDWLRQLVARSGDVPCVAGLIVDWEGERVDFADSYVTWHGGAGQLGFGDRLEQVPIVDGRELPFACGGSMLVERHLFLELGGFDPAFFAFLEDVDFGWRLRLAGHAVRLAAGARSYHRHHGTTGRLAEHERLRLYERNGLRMLLKNVGDENLGRVLAPALFLLAARAAHGPVDEVLRDLDAILAERARVQRLRRRPDAEVFATFARPFVPALDDERYLETSAALVRAFGLDELFGRRRATSLLVVGSGSGPRTAELAAAAARVVRVVYAATEQRARVDDVESLLIAGPRELDLLVAESDVVLVEASHPAAQDVTRYGRTIVVEPDRKPAEPLVEAADLVLSADDAAEALRALLESPSRLGPTEDAQWLLARRRRASGLGQPAHERVARALWQWLPEPARRRLRQLA